MTAITVVVPLFNEQPSLQALYDQLAAVLAGIAADWEIIFVDDGSSDGSFAVLTDLVDRDARARALRLRAHAGKAAALRAGFERAQGEIVVTMDADLQDDPAELPRLVARLREGFDLVSGWRRVRRDPRGKVIASRLFNRIVRAVLDLPLHDVNCGYKAYRRELLEQLHPYGELYRYMPAFAQHLGVRIGEVEVRHAKRRHGRSKYGPMRLPKALLDLVTVLLLTRYRDRPLHFFGAAALAVSLGAVVVCAGAAALSALGLVTLAGGWAWCVGALTLVVVVQLLGVGLVAEQWRATAGAPLPTPADEYQSTNGHVQRVSND